ncbi:3'(2'),5'-bisphosphate nucleotidase [Sulfurivirga caldicuralii]|uniref:3'(2'),5'-bisphosphate nucleotidase CysQ n=1 Tax=Sulfurivirga caldicuralii TaxID=364032 RepID=A0A1N6GBC1_9GAMM|nr:3'(2'),5'-bisphosphate nucleotidase CysQ [Sulfurivirga caldicuralii]SIO04818.1 3'(2'),5'-bisphosphate nucleotidase [Sulfurivirga caldicuralii]
MNNVDLRLWLPQVCALAEKAGASILEIYRSHDYDTTRKTDGSPVTTADTAADAIIIAGLQALTPDIPVVTEETLAEIPFERRRDWRTYWLVDPLDGTREFLARTDEFSVNIGLVVDGKPVLGVVYGPCLDTLYFGGPLLGAWRQQGAHVTPIRARKTLLAPARVAMSRRHGKRADAFAEALPVPTETVHMGSALKTCLVASGEADYYPRFGPTSYWDTAAGHAVLRAAGGDIVDMHGQPLRYVQSEDLLNPFFIARGPVIPAEALAVAAQLAAQG